MKRYTAIHKPTRQALNITAETVDKAQQIANGFKDLNWFIVPAITEKQIKQLGVTLIN